MHICVMSNASQFAQCFHMALSLKMLMGHVREPIADHAVHHWFAIEELNHLEMAFTTPVLDSMGSPVEQDGAVEAFNIYTDIFIPHDQHGLGVERRDWKRPRCVESRQREDRVEVCRLTHCTKFNIVITHFLSRIIEYHVRLSPI